MEKPQNNIKTNYDPDNSRIDSTGADDASGPSQPTKRSYKQDLMPHQLAENQNRN